MFNNLYIDFPSDFEERYEEYKEGILGVTSIQEKEVNVSYNHVTGIGYINSKKFRFTDGTSEYRIFEKLYKSINCKVSRYDVLEAIKFYEDGEDIDPARKTAETEAINKVAKSLRSKTGLNTEHLVVNNGNMTLVGENKPDNTQT